MRFAFVVALALFAAGGVAVLFLVGPTTVDPDPRAPIPDDRALGRIPAVGTSPEERLAILARVPPEHPFDPLAALPQPRLRVPRPVADDEARLRLLLRAKAEFLAFGVDFTPEVLEELRRGAAAEIDQLTAVVEAYEGALAAWRANAPPATDEAFSDLAKAQERFEPRVHGREPEPVRIVAYRYVSGAHVPLVADPFRDADLYRLHADVVAMSQLVHDKFTQLLVLVQARQGPR